jgi:chitinase
MKLNLSGATGGSTISDAQGTGTINDNDTVAAPSFSVSDASANEGSTVAFTITKTGSTSNSYSVSYASANNGSAVAGTDYGAVSGTVTFTASETSKTVFVQTYNDSASEGSETFVLNLSAPTGGATVGDGQGTGTIFNVDPPDPDICYNELGEIIMCP